jgi:DNA-binding protein HU-beta
LRARIPRFSKEIGDCRCARGVQPFWSVLERYDVNNFARRVSVMGDEMSDARRMGKSELFSHFAERFEVKRTQAREFFDELTVLAERELKRSGEFVLPGMVKLVVQKRKARMGRNPATGEAIKIPAKTVVKARIAKQLKDTVLPKK